MKLQAWLLLALLAGCAESMDGEAAWLAAHESCDFVADGQPVACEGNVPDLEVTDTLGIEWVCVRASNVNDQVYQIWMHVLDGRYAMRVLDEIDQSYFGIVSDDGTTIYDWQAHPGQFAIIPADLGPTSSLSAKMFTLNMTTGSAAVAGVPTVDHVAMRDGTQHIFHVAGEQTYHFSLLRDPGTPGYLSIMNVDFEWVLFLGYEESVLFEMAGVRDMPLAGPLNPGGCLAD